MLKGTRGRLVAALAACVFGAVPLGGAAAQDLPQDFKPTVTVETHKDYSYVLRMVPGDAAARSTLKDIIDGALNKVAAYFGSAFSDSLTITVVPNRHVFDEVLSAAWGPIQTQCWMVAAGVADFAVMIDPAVWADEACEHDGSDARHVSDIITHELTHSYHGQHNPTRDFTGMDDVGWFVEGLAVLVADQLHRDRLSDPREAVEKGAAPESLATAWSGKYRYGVSGSIVQYINETYGRDMIVSLLPETTQEGILSKLGMSEDALLTAWKAWVLSQDHADK